MKSEDAEKYVDLVVELFSPLLAAIEDPEEAMGLLIDLGYFPPITVTAFNTLSPTVEKLQNLIETLDEATDSEKVLETLLDILRVAGEMFRGINALSAAIKDNFDGSGLLTETDILDTIVIRLTDYLIARFLLDNYKTLYAGLLLTGVIDIEEVPNTPSPFRVPHLKWTINWDRISAFFSDPLHTFTSSLIDGKELRYRHLGFFLYMLGIGFDRYTEFVTPDLTVLATFNNGNDLSHLIQPKQLAPINDGNNLTPLSDINPLTALRFPLLSDPATTLGLVLYPVIDLATKKYTGVGVGVRFGGELKVPLSDAYQMIITFSSNLNDSLGVGLDTNGNLTFFNNIFSPNPEPLAEATQFGVSFSIVPTDIPTDESPQEKLFVIGVPQGSRLEIGSGSLKFGVEKRDSFRMFVEAGLKDGQIVLRADEADSFLSSLLPKDGITTNFDLDMGISNVDGLYFKGSSGLYIRLPLHHALGPINIEYLSIGFSFENDEFPLTLTSGFCALLGPLTAAVEDIGVRAVFTLKPDRSGNLGPIHVSFGFKPPKGVGLSIDASGITGGGFLAFDEANQR